MLPEAPQDHSLLPSSGKARCRVLVVDDDSIMATNLVELLGMEGYEAAGVHSGEQALEEIDTFQPDIILSDVKLTGMDGEMLLRRLRSDPKTAHIPVIFMTGYDEQNLSIEADGYLSKPFKIEEFLYLIRSISDHG